VRLWDPAINIMFHLRDRGFSPGVALLSGMALNCTALLLGISLVVGVILLAVPHAAKSGPWWIESFVNGLIHTATVGAKSSVFAVRMAAPFLLRQANKLAFVPRQAVSLSSDALLLGKKLLT